MIKLSEDDKREIAQAEAAFQAEPPTYVEALVTDTPASNLTPTPLATSPHLPPQNGPSRSPPRWKEALHNLQDQLISHSDARERDDAMGTARSEAAILQSMRTVGDAHPDARVRKSWRARARKFAAARGPDEKQSILHDVGSGIVAMVRLPFTIAGFALFATGTILTNTGKVITGAGHMLAGRSPKSFKPRSRAERGRV